MLEFSQKKTQCPKLNTWYKTKLAVEQVKVEINCKWLAPCPTLFHQLFGWEGVAPTVLSVQHSGHVVWCDCAIEVHLPERVVMPPRLLWAMDTHQ